jgi:isopenicillin-N N-acyltransferase like protein
VTHGKAVAVEIGKNLEVYLRRFEAAGASRSAIAAVGEEWAQFIASDNPEYADEMRGIAEGAGMPLAEVAILNARYEIAYSLFLGEARQVSGPPMEPDGCTSFGALPEATRSRHTIIGQNWDWLAGVRGQTLVLRVRRPDKPDFIGLTEAGIVGCKMGVNEAGIGLVVNGLVTPDDGKGPFRKPFHVRCREILDAWNLGHAIEPVVASDRVCSTNFMIGHGDGEIIDIEAAPNDAAYLYPVDGLVTHANHLVRLRSVRSEFERISPHSLYRGPRLDRMLRRHLGDLEIEHIRAAFCDHMSRPLSICRHEDMTLPEAKRVITVASVIIDLTARVLYVTDGQPCSNDHQAFALDPSCAVADLPAPMPETVTA